MHATNSHVLCYTQGLYPHDVSIIDWHVTTDTMWHSIQQMVLNFPFTSNIHHVRYMTYLMGNITSETGITHKGPSIIFTHVSIFLDCPTRSSRSSSDGLAIPIWAIALILILLLLLLGLLALALLKLLLMLLVSFM